MTSSISRGSRNRLLGLVVACAVLGVAGQAYAERKRVVVLAFEGPRAEKFHDDVVRMIRKVHTVVATETWNGTAEDMNATAVSDRNIKKVANKLKVDAVIEGKIEKRRDEYLIRLKLHDGKSGELVGQPVATKAGGPRIDGRAQREIQEELVDIIQNVESMHDSVVIEDEDEPPAKKTAKKTEDEAPAKKTARKTEDEDEDEPPAKKTTRKTEDEDDERPVRRGFGRLSDDDRGADRVDRKARSADDKDLPAKKASAEDDEDKPARKSAREDRTSVKAAASSSEDDGATRRANRGDDEGSVERRRKARKNVAARDEDTPAEAEAEVEAEVTPLDAETALSPAHRALDAVAGVSITMRRMTFAFRSDLAARPGGYKGRPIGGAMLDATLYPLALGHTRRDLGKDIGLHVMYDRVLFINTRDPMTGMVHPTKESRYSIGGVIRRALWDSPRALVASGTLDYSRQVFSISGQANLPSVQYTIFEPGGGLRMPLTSKLMAGVELKLMIVTSAGRIAAPTQYGGTRALGIEGAFAIDYRITRNVFARVAVRAETLQLTFDGTGELASMRDNDPETQDVSGARDNYLGGLVTAGYVY